MVNRDRGNKFLGMIGSALAEGLDRLVQRSFLPVLPLPAFEAARIIWFFERKFERQDGANLTMFLDAFEVTKSFLSLKALFSNKIYLYLDLNQDP